jgi:hypothetical protein
MALWGTADSLYSVGTVTVNYTTKTITGSGTSFTAAGISAGDVITIGAGGTFGSAIISSITSDTVITIAKTQSLSGAVIAGVAYSLSEIPVFTLEDSSYLYSADSQHVVYGVDKFEIATLAPGASGLSTQYGGIHAGWVGIQTYVDMHGNLRVKSETLVAMSEITSGTNATYSAPGDANDDAVFADAIITIVSQPESVGIGTTEDAEFVVEVDVTPDYAPLSYQWQEDDGGGFGDLSDGGDYSGTTTEILTVTNDNDKDGYEYQVIITSGDVSITSGIATITYV